MEYKEQIFKWMAENEDKSGNIRTADLFVFINSLPSGKKELLEDFDANTEEEIIIAEEPIHCMFGLSYASWFVVPRVILEAMPVYWQRKFVALVQQIDKHFSWHPGSDMFVQFRKQGKIIKTPDYYNNYRRPDMKWLAEINWKNKNIKQDGLYSGCGCPERE